MNILDSIFDCALFYDFRPVISPSGIVCGMFYCVDNEKALISEDDY
jgi:hypothetical protein